MKKAKKWLSLTLSGVLLTTALAGCSSGTGPSSSTETSGNDSESLPTYTCIGTPDSQISAALTIADKKGFDTESGVDLNLRMTPSGPDLASLVAGGGCDIAFASNYSVMTWINNDLDMTVIAVNDNMGGTQGAAIQSSIKLSSPKDLEGLKLGLLPGSEVEIAFRKLCAQYNVDYDKITKVPIQPADQLSAFEKGDIDICSSWEPWITYAENAGGKFLLSGTKCNIPGVPEDVDFMNIFSTISVTRDMMNNHKDDLSKVMQAINKATDFINNNREEAVSILSKEFEIEASDLTKIMERNIYEFGVTDKYKTTTQELYDYMIQNKILTKDFAFDDFHDFSILQNALPDNYKLS